MLCTTDDVFVSIEKVQKVALLVSKRHSVDDPLVFELPRCRPRFLCAPDIRDYKTSSARVRLRALTDTEYM